MYLSIKKDNYVNLDMAMTNKYVRYFKLFNFTFVLL